MGLLLLHEIDKGVCTHSDAFYTVEEELFIVMYAWR